MNDKVSKILCNLIYAFSANGITMVVSVITMLVIPKFISVEEYGYSQLYIFYANYIGFLHLGIPDGIYLRYGGKSYKELNKSLFLSQYWLSFLLEILIVVCITFSFCINVNIPEKKYVFFMLAIAAVIVLPRTFFQMVLQATNKIGAYGKMLVIEKIIYCLMLFLFIYLKELNFRTIILSDIIGKLFAFLYTCLVCKVMLFGKFISLKNALYELSLNLRAGSKLMLANVATLLLIGVIRIGIEYQWDIEVYGKVSLAINVSNFILVFINAIGIVIFPVLKRMPSQILPELYERLKLIFAVVFSGFLILYYPMQIVIKSWLPQYEISLQYMVLIFPMCVYECFVSMLINTYMKSLRKEKELAFINGISLLVSVALTILSTIILKNLIFSFVSIHIVYMLRFIIADVYLCKVLKKQCNTLGLIILCVAFSVSGWYLDTLQSCLIYSVLYIGYIVINKKKLYKAYKEILKIMY